MDEREAREMLERASGDADLYLLGLSELKIPEGRKANAQVVALLKESIARLGVINPITVYRDKDTHEFVLVAGMNRVAACKELGLDGVPAVVLRRDEPTREIELAENVARLHLTPEQLEECRAFEAKVLAEKQATMSLRAAAEETGVPRSTAHRRVSKQPDLSTVPGGTVERSPEEKEVAPTLKRRGKDGKARPARTSSAAAIKKRRAKAQALRDEGVSMPKIAEALGVSLGTVAADLEAQPPTASPKPAAQSRPAAPAPAPTPAPTSAPAKRTRRGSTEELVLPLPAEQLATLDALRGPTPRVDWLLTLVQAALAPARAARTRALVERALAEASAEPDLAVVVQDLEVALERFAS